MSADKNVVLNTESRIRRIARGIILFIISILLLFPIILCHLTNQLLARIFIIIIFVIIYLTILVNFTRSKVIELTLAGAT
jgi:hypothetical protein